LGTLTFHESIPGHHLQLSLQQEADLPLIRKVIGLCQEFGWRLCVDGHWREARQYYRHKPSSAGRAASMNNVIDLNGFGKKHESPLHPVGRRCGDA